MMKEHIATWLPSIIIILFFSGIAQTSRPFTIILKEVVRCEDSGTNEIRFASTRLSKVSRNVVNYLSNYTLSITLDDNIAVISELEAWGNGGWRPGFFTHDTPHLCTGFKQLNPKWFQELIKNTGRDDCPIPPGTYQVTAYNISFVEINVPMWETGKYRLINKLYKEDVLVGCLGMVIVVTPKSKPFKKKN